jgi:hypothetical protein
LAGKKPSWRAARRSGLRLPGNPATHTGTPGILNWAGQELDAVDGVVAAAVVHRRTGPGDGEDLEN